MFIRAFKSLFANAKKSGLYLLEGCKSSATPFSTHFGNHQLFLLLPIARWLELLTENFKVLI